MFISDSAFPLWGLSSRTIFLVTHSFIGFLFHPFLASSFPVFLFLPILEVLLYPPTLLPTQLVLLLLVLPVHLV